MSLRDESELKRLNARYRTALLAYFYRRTGNHADAQDLTQDVFVKLANSNQNEIHNADAYIFHIAANLLRDRGRRGRTKFEAFANIALLEDIGIERLDPDRVLVGKEELNAIMGYLQELSERTQTIFILYRIEGIGQNELAATFQISKRAVQKHVFKAMAHVVQRLTAEEKT